jgi:hypothetical protein
MITDGDLGPFARRGDDTSERYRFVDVDVLFDRGRADAASMSARAARAVAPRPGGTRLGTQRTEDDDDRDDDRGDHDHDECHEHRWPLRVEPLVAGRDDRGRRSAHDRTLDGSIRARTLGIGKDVPPP